MCELDARRLAPGWTASRCCWWHAGATVDPARPDADRLLVAWRTPVPLTPDESRNRIETPYGSILLRDATGVLRIMVAQDHDAVWVVGRVWPETVLAVVGNRPLPRVVELPFGYPPGVFVRGASNVDDGERAPFIRLWLSRPLWWFGPVPFACGEECGD